MNKILKFLKAERRTIQLNIYLDTLQLVNNIPIVLNVKSDMKLCYLLEKNRLHDTDIHWFINGRFCSNDIKFEDVFEIYYNKKSYNVYILHIMDQEKASINYDLERFLYKKCESRKTSCAEIQKKNSFDVINIEWEICEYCESQYPAFQSAIFLNCGHKFCKKCAKNIIFHFSKFGFQCVVKDCSNVFSDHEIQKVLELSDYEDFEELMTAEIEKNQSFLYPKIGWICQACTFINFPVAKFCNACENNRPDDYITPTYWQPSPDEHNLARNLIESELIILEEENKRVQKEKEDQRICLQNILQLTKEQVSMTCEETECPVCMVTYEAGEAIILHSCLHTICKECFRNYLKNQENSQVKCPTSDCMGMVENQEIQGVLTVKEYEVFEEMTMRIAEAKTKQAFHCQEPNCVAWVIIEGLTTGSFKCPRCKRMNCISCKAIHVGMTCKQYHDLQLVTTDCKMTPEDELFIQKMLDSGEAMKCPGCGILIQKSRGCDGVTCRSCGIMMCWATKGPRWGPKGKGDTSGGCGCRYYWGQKCHPDCHYCH